MDASKSILSVKKLYAGRSVALPDEPGVYAFWWIGDRKKLMAANRHIKLKGPGGKSVDVTYDEWWPSSLEFPCLYVGKSTNIKKRFSLHIKRGSAGRLHTPIPGNHKAKPRTTSCQLRWGIEHVFPLDKEPLETIFESVGFSFRTDFPRNAIAERFFEEDRLVGLWRPWFNIDSER